MEHAVTDQTEAARVSSGRIRRIRGDEQRSAQQRELQTMLIEGDTVD